jgi:hypothetical protein
MMAFEMIVTMRVRVSVGMLVGLVIDMEMCRTQEVQIHGGQYVERHGEDQEPSYRPMDKPCHGAALNPDPRRSGLKRFARKDAEDARRLEYAHPPTSDASQG